MKFCILFCSHLDLTAEDTEIDHLHVRVDVFMAGQMNGWMDACMLYGHMSMYGTYFVIQKRPNRFFQKLRENIVSCQHIEPLVANVQSKEDLANDDEWG